MSHSELILLSTSRHFPGIYKYWAVVGYALQTLTNLSVIQGAAAFILQYVL